MTRQVTFPIALAFVWVLCLCNPVQAEKRVALVIGNSAYKNVPSLPNPSKDAQSVGALLKQAGFDRVDIRQNLGNAELRRAIGDFAEQIRNADVAVVFYAGHGMEAGGSNYIIPVDAKLERDYDIEDETVSLDRMLRVLEPAKRLRLVILDACRNNPFAATMKRTISTRDLGRGLAKVEPPMTDTLIAFAAKAGSTADDGAGENSPFTSAVMKHLSQPGLDLRIAFGLVRDEVLKATQNRQEPFVYGSLGGGITALVPGQNNFGSAQPVITPAVVRPHDEQKADFEQAQKTNTAAGWQAFLRLYPSGPFADRARDKLALLTPGGAQPQTPAPAVPATAAIADLATNSAQLIYSPWVKFCVRGQEPNARNICMTGKDARVESGASVVAAVLIEPEGEPKKILRITLPLGVQVAPGTRVLVDQSEPIAKPYVLCMSNGCMADYDVTADLLTRMRKGKQLSLQAIDASGKVISLAIPLADFVTAHDGPPTDPKAFQEQQQKLQDELKRRADEARRKLGGR